jgi:hypothetical protein
MKILERLRENRYNFDADWRVNIVLIALFAVFAYLINPPGYTSEITPFGLTVLAVISMSGWLFFATYGAKWYYQLHPDKLQKLIEHDKAQNDKILRFLHLKRS